MEASCPSFPNLRRNALTCRESRGNFRTECQRASRICLGLSGRVGISEAVCATNRLTACGRQDAHGACGDRLPKERATAAAMGKQCDLCSASLTLNIAEQAAADCESYTFIEGALCEALLGPPRISVGEGEVVPRAHGVRMVRAEHPLEGGQGLLE